VVHLLRRPRRPPCALSAATPRRPPTWRRSAPKRWPAISPISRRWHAHCEGVEPGAGLRPRACSARGRHRSENIDDRGHRALIDAARSAGVKRFVYISGYGSRPDHPVELLRQPSTRSRRSSRNSGLDAVVLRPTAFMEHHAHLFNGKNVLEKGKAQLIGPGTKPRNFVCAGDVAQHRGARPCSRTAALSPARRSAAGALQATPMWRRFYARTAGMELRVSHLPAAVAKTLAVLARPLHPGVARVLRLAKPADGLRSPSASRAKLDFERDLGVRMTPLEEFVARQVQAAGSSRGRPDRRCPGTRRVNPAISQRPPRLHASSALQPRTRNQGSSMKYKFAALAAAFACVSLLGGRAGADRAAGAAHRSARATPARCFDAHLHYNDEAVERYPIATSSAGCSAAACARSSPTAGPTTAPRRSRRRAKRRDAPALHVVPFVRLYRNRADYSGWHADPTIVEMVLRSSPPARRRDPIAASASSISTTAPTPTGRPRGG
jgi:nucleoside-diphosphate-sugar epimerase